jgi:hypothetical protein
LEDEWAFFDLRRQKERRTNIQKRQAMGTQPAALISKMVNIDAHYTTLKLGNIDAP